MMQANELARSGGAEMTKTTRNTALVLAAVFVGAPAGAFAQEAKEHQEQGEAKGHDEQTESKGHDEQAEAKEHDELAKAMKDAKVSLERGVSAAGAREGKPISAKYEMDNGKLQLSVYTTKGHNFSEVIVDHRTGKVAKAEPITSGDDLTAAKDQKEAMAKAKRSLQAATADAAKKNPGYRAVSATPRLEEGRPVAVVTLFKGDDWKKVSERLDTAK
jgi:hypothetical protein